jgi:hypothetical protein
VNELNTTTHRFDSSQAVSALDFERLLLSPLPRNRLLPLVREGVKQAIARFVQQTFIASSAGDSQESKKVLDYLRGASAIPLPPELCTLMARVGFDKALFTYEHSDGISLGYAEGIWLLEFVEAAEKVVATAQETSWIESLGRDVSSALRHCSSCWADDHVLSGAQQCAC